MSPELPAALHHAIAGLLEGVSRNELAQRSARITEFYRSGSGSSHAVVDARGVIAYLVARLPATYAAMSHALSEISLRAPGFSPTSLLDAGAGPGTASWAALQAWPTIPVIRMLDDKQDFLDMAARLAAGHPALATAQRIRGGLNDPRLPHSDLVIASYVLAELAESGIAAAVSALWAACTGMLVLVEPGTPAGHRRILECRETLLAHGARIVAPCPHAMPCPLRAPDWCHFVQRLPRTRDHLAVKQASVPFEDEKFCYLVVARDGIDFAGASARVLAPPRQGKAGIELKLCESGKVDNRTVTKRQTQDFSYYRRLRWGDAL